MDFSEKVPKTAEGSADFAEDFFGKPVRAFVHPLFSFLTTSLYSSPLLFSAFILTDKNNTTSPPISFTSPLTVTLGVSDSVWTAFRGDLRLCPRYIIQVARIVILRNLHYSISLLLLTYRCFYEGSSPNRRFVVDRCDCTRVSNYTIYYCFHARYLTASYFDSLILFRFLLVVVKFYQEIFTHLDQLLEQRILKLPGRQNVRQSYTDTMLILC